MKIVSIGFFYKEICKDYKDVQSNNIRYENWCNRLSRNTWLNPNAVHHFWHGLLFSMLEGSWITLENLTGFPLLWWFIYSSWIIEIEDVQSVLHHFARAYFAKRAHHFSHMRDYDTVKTLYRAIVGWHEITSYNLVHIYYKYSIYLEGYRRSSYMEFRVIKSLKNVIKSKTLMAYVLPCLHIEKLLKGWWKKYENVPLFWIAKTL